MPVAEYMAAPPTSLRVLFHAIFGGIWGGGDAGEDASQQVAHAADTTAPAPLAHVGIRKNNAKEQILSYFLVTMFFGAVRERAYRPPHASMLIQVFKSHGATRKVNDFEAGLGLCLSDSQCRKREELVVQ